MLTSTLTVKGQVTLPVNIRRELNVKPSDKIIFNKIGGKFVIEKLLSIDQLYGSLKSSKVKPLSFKKMNDLIKKGLFSDR
ncbi:hypothetical protein A3D84_03710 [Candidatus Woesebacteria bacterium RIFCSPHIGHO2_02_FULL_42_20]|uniref:SpoVT-AbrB domain-containing protein n=1 Tax=Candidatus Woesebacteria bacterium RIFCSPHIGHO2_12_FULL_41_24 TaxID=1802510 RepID=A0A1F8AU67_9BACT|nr:MAG: hypothetical protein A2W15_03860 [Candidatus Woesebacteria bacterium RBG_16_41_13]OGM29157.1 MAG: hypothetical protein A2873_01455 [Candidatus Woesebacteria bacterium RIFCSPHIGHO2_01_FULL_42_80]OGM35640.1 MAG: hypothetical protein A3D84_03710 [Candidatus Woesebacteria bacterium RIFCSPHIGHO2_02_FULL_42_20]OGM55251.1 MAG: hypothetical protein A3E44_03120 [Candidatus Woesebacteria bacterium RIFCSPHIGHO2_12_FULL_41_24]OGM67205.1 MAG: hypothetical protein A2969_04845 [Candidatus Woesebacteri